MFNFNAPGPSPFFVVTDRVLDATMSDLTHEIETGLYYVETAATLLYDLRRSTTTTDIIVSCSTFYRTVTGVSASGSLVRLLEVFSEELATYLPFHQSAGEWLDICDAFYGNLHRVKGSILGRKLISVFNHIMAHAFYAKVGIVVDHSIFSKLEKRKIVPTVWTVATFADAIVGLVLFLAKAGRQAILTKSVDAFFIDEKVVTTWIETASRLRKDAEFLGNPTAVGIDIPTFINDVRENIADGNRLLKIFSKGSERTILHSVLLELECVERRFTTVMVASSFRRCPVGVFVYGGSGVAKSFIAQGLFNHYCSIRGISKERAILWTRTENDKFYSGYKSHFAGVLFDDAAKHQPSKIQGIDESVGEIISAANNIPFLTPQGELCDKGKIPFLSEWVGVTSNVGDLNADIYYKCSNAFLRRLPYRIEPVVKPPYCIPGEQKIDPTKIPAGVQYPDLWTFEVSRVAEEGMRGAYVPYKTFPCYSSLLAFMTEVYTKHIDNQDKLMATVAAMGPEVLCECGMPESLCQCEYTPEPNVDVAVTQVRSPHWSHPVVACSLASDTFEQRRFKIECLRREILLARYCTGASFLHMQHVLDEGLWATLVLPDVSDYNCEDYLEALLHEYAQSMDSFEALRPWEKLSELNGIDYIAEAQGLPFLSFTPDKTRKCFFMSSQLHKLHEYILSLVGDSFNHAERALLEQYVYEFAPQFVADGWTTCDIVKGSLDYVKYYGKTLEDPSRLATREVLLADRTSLSWKQCLIGHVSNWYFSNAYFNAVCNHLSQYRVCKWLYGGNFYFGLHTLVLKARKYDRDLLGAHPYVRKMLAWATAFGFIAMAVAVLSRLRPAPPPPRVPEVPSTVVAYTDLTDKEEDDETASQDLSGCEPSSDGIAQLAVHPVVRPTEKVNVWVTKERTITKFDYVPEKPNSLEQMMARVKGNCLVAELHFPEDCDHRMALTRILAINSQTLLINNHACTVGMKMRIWLDKKTAEGVQPVVELLVVESMVTRDPSRDVAFIRTLGMPSLFKDISACFPYKTMTAIGESFYLVRGEDGSINQLSCYGLCKRKLCRVAGGESIDHDMWSTSPTRPTVAGECGSPLFVITKHGPVLIGIHSAYSAAHNIFYAAPLYNEDFPKGKFPQRGVLSDVVPILQTLRLPEGAKLYTDYHREGSMLVHGQVSGFRARPKASGGHTQIAHHVLVRGDEFDPPIEDRMARPEMGSWKQPQRVLSEYLSPTHSMREDVWVACIESFQRHIESCLSPEDLRDMHPVDIDVAVNGYPGVPNVDAVKFTTSGGHGRRGPKSQFFTEPSPNGVWEHYREPLPDLRADIEKLVSNAKLGIRPHAIYTAVLKDEMLSKAKVAAGKTRCIYMCPVDFLIAMRMVSLGITRVMVRRKEVFRHSVGLNTHSEEWDDLYQSANRIPGDFWVAGDFRGFDTLLSILISNGVCMIFVFCARISKMFTEDEILWLETMLADCANASVDFFGTLVTLLGGEVSGHQLTTFFNSIANTLLHMYAYVMLTCCVKQSDLALTADCFFIDVFNTTLGDDVFLKVHPRAGHYNHTTIQLLFSEIGIVYTMADKNASSVPYISWTEVTFLKRCFREHTSFPGVMVAPLEKLSIYKMLLYTVPSGTVSPEEQLAQAICSAVTESFYHGRDFFDQICELIRSIPVSPELGFRMTEYPAPNWELLEKRFLRASPKLRASLSLPEDYLENTETSATSYCQPDDVELQMVRSVECAKTTTLGRPPLERIYAGVPLSSKSVPQLRSSVDKP
jgi:hypothetical protein